jgi:hypothetical protein
VESDAAKKSMIEEKIAPKIKKVLATPKEMVAQSTIICSAANDERILAVVPVEQGCELLYTKVGETKTIASASFELSYCEAVQTRISKKLETSGFICK